MNVIVCCEVLSIQRLIFKNKCVGNTHLAKAIYSAAKRYPSDLKFLFPLDPSRLWSPMSGQEN